MRSFNNVFLMSIALLSLPFSGCAVGTADISGSGPQPMDRSVFHVSVDPEPAKLAGTKSSSELFALWKGEVVTGTYRDTASATKLEKALGLKLQREANDPVYPQILAFALDKPKMMPGLLANIGTCGAVDIAVAMRQRGEEMIARSDTAGYDMRDTANNAFRYIKGDADPKIVSACLRGAGW